MILLSFETNAALFFAEVLSMLKSWAWGGYFVE